MGAAATDTNCCPRCGGAIHCGVNDASPCACTTLVLAPAALAALHERYSGCLCLRCLRQLQLQQPAPGEIDLASP